LDADTRLSFSKGTVINWSELTTEIQQKVAADNKAAEINCCRKLLTTYRKTMKAFDDLVDKKFDGDAFLDYDYATLSVAELKIYALSRFRPNDEPLIVV